MPDSSSSSSSEDDSFGPALPPHLAGRQVQSSPQVPRRRPVAGPAAPPPPGHHVPRRQRPQADSDDDDSIGPMPPPASRGPVDDLGDVIAEVEERVARAREEEERKNQPEKLERGDWMLVPPEANRLLPMIGDAGMKSRQFSKKEVVVDVDQSGWTETPQERAMKTGEKRKRPPPKDGPRAPTQDELQTREFIEQHNLRHRGTALMDKHMTTYVRDGKIDDTDVSKRRFDRDTDMGGSRKVDNKSRQDMLDKARKLDTKFSHGAKTFL